MDPEARRFMWKVVSNISNQRKKSAVLLTTHSMDEAEALSTKMGIMVEGGVFKCMGSSQHIKDKFGTGYEIEIKVKKMTSEIELLELKMKYNLSKKENLSLIQVGEIINRGCNQKIA
jgi:ATP-binding cassette, subfamily A (ABC1), member 3